MPHRPHKLISPYFQITGVTGLKMQNLVHLLDLVKEGKIDLNSSIAALGGMNSVPEAIKAVESRKYPGKIVIYPHLEDLPLLSLSEHAKRSRLPDQALAEGLIWTSLAEESIFNLELVHQN